MFCLLYLVRTNDKGPIRANNNCILGSRLKFVCLLYDVVTKVLKGIDLHVYKKTESFASPSAKKLVTCGVIHKKVLV